MRVSARTKIAALAFLPASMCGCVRSGGADPAFTPFAVVQPGHTTMREVADRIDPPDAMMMLPTAPEDAHVDREGVRHAAGETRLLRVWLWHFYDIEARNVYEGRRSRRYAALQTVIERKLQMLDAAASLDDLRSPPGNRLEALGGDRKGQHSIRINQQFRICFRWTPNGPENVEIVDYH